ncbi:MAG: EAL domain-containing protein [Terracidiphilus sp.]|jgi:diguanylate cyclase (GGDEF)-like protein
MLAAGGILRAQEFSFRTLGSAEGLDNLEVRKIYQDRAGFLWVSTENGIYRYDGERFEIFGPARGMPLANGVALGEAPDGSLLAGGDFGLFRLHDNHFERVSGAFKRVEWRQGIQSDGRGHTFLAADAGLIELDSVAGQSGFTQRIIPQAAGVAESGISAVLADGETVWYGCGAELCRMDGSGTRVYGRESGLPESAAVGIVKDGAGALWLRYRVEGVFVMAQGESRFRRPVGLAKPDATVGVPAVDEDGRILLPTPDGLLMQEKKGWRTIDRTAGLRGVVMTAYEDRQHSLWLGMAGRGLMQWRGYREWESYSAASGLASEGVNEILPQANGTVWLGTTGGLMRGDRRNFGMRWTPVEGLKGFPIRSVRAGADGDLWVSTETRGIARRDQKTGSLSWFGEKQGLLSKMVLSLRFDREQRLWAATEAGLFVASPPYTRFNRINEIGSSWIWCVEIGSDGTVWAGGVDGLFAMAGGRWSKFSRSDGLTNQEVLSLGAGDKGMVWVGYRFGGGIDRVHLQGRRLMVEKGLQRRGADGLVTFLDFDAAGRLWAGTEHGVEVWDGAGWNHYDTGDGLIWNDCNLNSFAAEPDGTVWIGTSGGISRFKPMPRTTAVAPLKVVFTRLTMGKKDVSGENDPAFTARANSFVARYSVLNAPRQNGVLFRYRLEGGNAAWTETTLRELQFAQLAPGDYRLQVEAEAGDGVWGGSRTEFAFRILTPWYLSWWFIGICAMIPLATAWALLRLRMAGLVRRELAINRLMRAHEEIRNLAFYDPLTGLPNRRLLLDRLQKALTTSARSGRLGALLFSDLDQFKKLNDTLGHPTGDLLLQEVARRITACVRESDTVARLGGDEFVVMLDELSNIPEVAAAQTEIIAEKILAAISRPSLLEGRECVNTASIGVTVFGDCQASADEVLQQADIAMYQAKSAGRNTVRFFAPSLQAAVNARAAMEEDMRVALREDQFLLYFQPQVDWGATVGAEALVRWRHPQLGLVLPDKFIPLAEESGLILPLGDWVLNAACRQIAAWTKREETAHLTLAVNISARQFREPEFVGKVLTALETAGISAENLKLELTESMLVENIEDVIAKMRELKAYGITFSLDDFGTGYSSLNYLKLLPLDELKIDLSFVRSMHEPGGGAIVQAILSLGRAMNLKVVAEGVETEQQREFLAGLGCHTYQGYLFSRPVPIEAFERLLKGTREMAGTVAG